MAISNPSVVSPRLAATIKVVNRPPGGVGAGQAFEVIGYAYDPYGNLATSFNDPMTVTLANGSSGTLIGTTTVAAVNGVATFPGLSDDTSGSISLNVDTTDNTVTGGNSGSVTVTPNVATKLVIATQPSQTATAGVAFATQPVVYEEDQYGNLEASDSTTIVTAYLGSGAGPLQGTVTATLADGVATFTNLSDDTAETITLQFTGAGLTSLASVPIVVSPAAASELVIHSQPSSSATVHQAFATQPVIYELDRFGNLETGDSSTSISAIACHGHRPARGYDLGRLDRWYRHIL